MTKPLNLTSLLANWNSGATLFTILLNNHSHIITHGETFAFSEDDKADYRCSCGELTNNCEHFRACAKHMLDSKEQAWDSSQFVRLRKYSNISAVNSWLLSFNYMCSLRDLALRLVPSYRKRNRFFLHSQRRFFENSLKRQQASVYMDGTKSIRRAELFAKDKQISQRVIHFVRDGRGFCGSRKKAILSGRIKSDKSMVEFAKDWVAYEEMVKEFFDRNPQVPFITVRYEDLCRDPESTMKEVASFLGVKFEASLLGKEIQEFHVLGNHMKDNFSGSIKEDLSWKTTLSEDEQREITETMKKELSEYGYI